MNPKGGIPEWQMEHIGMAARVTRDNRPLSWKEYKDEIATLDVADQAVPPVKYDKTTWEYNIRYVCMCVCICTWMRLLR